MPATVDIGTLITRKPGVKGGRPIIAGTGTSVQAIVIRYERGLSPQEIQSDRPDLSLEGIFAALAYWAANREEIEGYFREEEEAHDAWFGRRD